MACGLGFAAGALRSASVALVWTGVALLGCFALWSALSVIWSAAPDETWLAANRAIAYTVIAAVAVIAASNTRAAPRGVAIGLAAASLVVALYALGGKIVPGLHIAFFDLNPGRRVLPGPRADRILERGRDPLRDGDPGLHLADCLSRTAAARVRVGALLALVVLVLTTACTYSRGALLAYLAVLAVMVGAGPAAAAPARAGVGAVVGAMPSIASRSASTTSPPVASRCTSEPDERGGSRHRPAAQPRRRSRSPDPRAAAPRGRVRWTPRRARGSSGAGWPCGAWPFAIAVVGTLAVSSRGLTGRSRTRSTLQGTEGRAGERPRPADLLQRVQSLDLVAGGAGAFSDKPLGGWGQARSRSCETSTAVYDDPGALDPQRSAPVPLRHRAGRSRCWGSAASGMLGAARAKGARYERGRALGAPRAARCRNRMGGPLAGRLGLGDPGGDDPGPGCGHVAAAPSPAPCAVPRAAPRPFCSPPPQPSERCCWPHRRRFPRSPRRSGCRRYATPPEAI